MTEKKPVFVQIVSGGEDELYALDSQGRVWVCGYSANKYIWSEISQNNLRYANGVCT
jgi:hypothetical protein